MPQKVSRSRAVGARDTLDVDILRGGGQRLTEAGAGFEHRRGEGYGVAVQAGDLLHRLRTQLHGSIDLPQRHFTGDIHKSLKRSAGGYGGVVPGDADAPGILWGGLEERLGGVTAVAVVQPAHLLLGREPVTIEGTHQIPVGRADEHPFFLCRVAVERQGIEIRTFPLLRDFDRVQRLPVQQVGGGEQHIFRTGFVQRHDIAVGRRVVDHLGVAGLVGDFRHNRVFIVFGEGGSAIDAVRQALGGQPAGRPVGGAALVR